MQEFLSEFADLLGEPHGLPPISHQDHHIHLFFGSILVEVRSFRCSFVQNDEIIVNVATLDV